MIRILLKAFTLILLSIPLHATGIEVAASRSFTIGHQNNEMIELKESKGSAGQQWSIRHYSNGYVVSGRALTEKTYLDIIRDWDKIFPDKKDDGRLSCKSIVLIKSIRDGRKIENVCSRAWSKSKRKQFTNFYDNLKNISASRTQIY